jgi:TPR repeat protein
VASAQCSLGERYLNGDGVDQDKAKARDYLKAAANQGYDEAVAALKGIDDASK